MRKGRVRRATGDERRSMFFGCKTTKISSPVLVKRVGSRRDVLAVSLSTRRGRRAKSDETPSFAAEERRLAVHLSRKK